MADDIRVGTSLRARPRSSGTANGTEGSGASHNLVPGGDLDQLIAQAEQVTSRQDDLEGRVCPRYLSVKTISSRVKFS